ncbi:dihydroorotate dehydrogenase electron transfer subunit [Maribellus comscasis]|uniref:Dihydroorotate dehydrogenase electron transfer subunit n=1 Tax=Maribellus comscasis TaxID=2681766 RepID=A0A6I6K0X6_9BACT|nr:dihydroorotate dehydrogenase electron transfer subunit [Maribellus comscasis]QGY47100.1 dihydroorotate dehydrogenase electron transfer subunit [Maribellus comscasis]
MSKKFVEEFKVVENIALNSSNFLIKLLSKKALPQIAPGQFVNVEVKNSKEIFLRRPFSVFEVDYTQNTMSLIVKILGRGSKKLTEAEDGDTINIVYPLGKSFSYPEKEDKVLLIGGGSGVAPMLFLAKESGLVKENVDILLGARSKEDHIDVSDYAKYGNLHYTTEDGSLGEKGFVTHHSIFEQINNYNKIYACGPDAMMKAVAKIAKKEGVFCEVSLENLMACGFGVCLCCIEPTQKGNLCICTEGPVFNIKELKW